MKLTDDEIMIITREAGNIHFYYLNGTTYCLYSPHLSKFDRGLHHIRQILNQFKFEYTIHSKKNGDAVVEEFIDYRNRIFEQKSLYANDEQQIKSSPQDDSQTSKKKKITEVDCEPQSFTKYLFLLVQNS